MKPQYLRKPLAHIFGLLILGTAALNANAQPPGPAMHVREQPPPMRIEHVPQARPGHVWAGGYWGWNGGAHVWYPGRYIPERPGYRYVGPNWVFINGGWVLSPAYWTPVVVAPAPVIVQPAPVVVQEAPVEYIQQPQPQQQPQQVAPPPGLDPNYWYYCDNPAGYYPYVQSCDAWQQVSPTPPQQ